MVTNDLFARWVCLEAWHHHECTVLCWQASRKTGKWQEGQFVWMNRSLVVCSVLSVIRSCLMSECIAFDCMSWSMSCFCAWHTGIQNNTKQNVYPHYWMPVN
jgi:hypothetical protein